MKTIELHGILRKKFGRFFRLDVKTAREATHALACQIPKFKQFMLESDKLGYQFAVFNGKKKNQKTNISEQQLDSTTTAHHIHIVPKVIGSGGKSGGWLQVIAGAVMVVVGVMTSWAGGGALIGAGVGLLMGGVSSLLMPTPKLDDQNEDGNKPNNGFGGAVTMSPKVILYQSYMALGKWADLSPVLAFMQKTRLRSKS